MFAQVETQEGPNKFTYPYKDNVAIIVQEPPYGFLRVYLERGETPVVLKDQRFTSIDYAKKSIDAELSRQEALKLKKV